MFPAAAVVMGQFSGFAHDKMPAQAPQHHCMLKQAVLSTVLTQLRLPVYFSMTVCVQRHVTYCSKPTSACYAGLNVCVYMLL